MTIDFLPTLAYPRLHQWPPTFGGPVLLEPCKRFRDNRDEAYLSTEQPRARPSPRFSCPQGDGWRPQDSGQPPRAGPQETVGLRAGAAPAELVRTLSKRCEFLAANRGLRFPRSEEHPSELQSLMRISYAVFCLKTKKQQH